MGDVVTETSRSAVYTPVKAQPAFGKTGRRCPTCPLLFTLGGALAGLAYYYLVGCSSGSCAITSNPLSSMLYLGLAGLILSGAFCPCCGKDSCDT